MADDWKTSLAKGLINSIPALLILLGAVFVLVGVAGGAEYHDFPPLDTASRLAAGAFGSVLLGLGYRRKTFDTLGEPDSYGVRINR